MYTSINFPSKKAFKDHVAQFNAYVAWEQSNGATGLKPPYQQPVTVYQPGPFGGDEPSDGTVTIEGPHYPKPHKWYARATLKGGVVVKVS